MPRNRHKRAWRTAGLALLSTLLLAGCSRAEIEDNLRFGWPTGITDQAEQMRLLWSWSCVAALAVGCLVWGLTFWASAFHRKKNDELPRQTAYNLPLEVVYTAFPFVAIAILFYYTIVVQNFVTDRTAKPDHSVEVTAYKWNWQFQYDDTTDTNTSEMVKTTGTTDEIPVLVLPAGSKIKFSVHSQDVVHSFWIPEFLYKLDVIPHGFNKDGTLTDPQGQGTNQFIVDIKKGTEGAYVGRCAELCGVYHAQMNFELRVVAPDKYDEYVKARESGKSNSEALKSIGEAPYATSTHPFNPQRTAHNNW
ncbi:aa3-type cytochrome oxidase subunit II [Cumulibacter manganitolerans]|uniref:aa3-type cytochrome oxidase subunit II n=1 Tax=Cumulibacter manganitolerans TaxID=1884992 RepID=UPI0012964F69|nr:cytochrome c oxidase subunit II [Cumulibacter manganitolerans]